MLLSDLNKKFDELQNIYGSSEFNAVFGGGCEKKPDLFLVFINPTARNIATHKDWKGIRCQWLGTKQVWKFLTNCGLFDSKLNAQIQNMKPNEWTPEFCERVYSEVRKQKVYITNIAKCTQADARALPDKHYKEYINLLKEEIKIVQPKKIILFGNQTSSLVLDEKISVSTCRKQEFKLQVGEQVFSAYAVFYPVGNGFFNADKAVEDIKFIKEK